MIKNLFKAVMVITIFSVLTRALGFGMRIYLGRTIGAEGVGLFQIAMSIFMVLLTAVASGLPTIISKKTSEMYKDSATENGKIIFAGLKIAVYTSVVLCFLAFLLKSPINSLLGSPDAFSIFLLLLPAVFLHALQTPLLGYLWGKKYHLENSLIEFLEQLLRLALCMILITTNSDPLAGAKMAALALSISCLFSTTLSFFFFFKKGGKIKFSNAYTKSIFKQSSPVTLVRFISSFSAPLISFIIPLRLMEAGYTNENALSLLGISTGMTLPLLFIPSAVIGSLAMALVPELGGLIGRKKHDEAARKIKSSITFSIFISACFIPLFSAAGPAIGEFLYANSLSGELLAFASPMLIPIGICGITTSILNAIGLEKKSLKNYSLGAVALLLSIYFLPSVIGINSLIVGMFSFMSITSIFNIIMIKKHMHIKNICLLALLKICLILLPVTLLTTFMVNLLSLSGSLFLALSIGGIVSALFFFLLCLAFNIIDLSYFKGKFKNKFSLSLKRKKGEKSSPTV